MKKYEKSQYVKSTVAMLCAAAMLTLGAFVLLCGCSGNVDLTFTVETVNLLVGETRDFTPYAVFTPSTVKDKSFTLSSDDYCVRTDGKTVTAVASGTATVYAEAYGKRASVSVVCTYREATWLGITCDESKLIQTVGETENIKFTAVTGEYIDPALAIEWTVNGRVAGAGYDFEYLPESCGEYCVRARVNELDGSSKISDDVAVRVYAPSEAFGTLSGELVQYRDFSSVRFTACELIDTVNPPSVYEWTVNGNVCGTDRFFEYTPHAAGEYEVKLKVNGTPRKISGKDSAVISASGLRAPCGEVIFDNSDKTLVTWRDGEYVKSVTVVSPDGQRKVYSASELSQAERFARGAFDATGIIEVCAENPDKYVLRLTGDVAGAEFEFLQYPSDAEQYLKAKIYTKNAFLSSVDDCADFMTELYLIGERSGRAYIARELDTDDAESAVRERAAQLRLDVGVSVEGRVLSVTAGEYVNSPTSDDEVNTVQSYTVTPHLEYTQSNRRGDGYVLACDRRKELSVSNTEQLWYAVTRGYKPKITDDTTLKAYNRARTVLLSIIGKDYTDAQKVHAIYDWVQWAAPRSYTTELGSSARFIDAVFVGAPDLAKAGVQAEGAAKTVALLCGMEGIECDVISDGAYKNVVTVDGERYYVDVNAGKLARELCTHAGLLIPVDEFTKPITYSVQKHIYNGAYFDYRIDKSECNDYVSVEAAIFYAFGGQNYNSVSIRGAFGTVHMSSTLYGAEFECSALDESEINKVTENVVRAVKAFGKTVGAGYSDTDVTVRMLDGGIVGVSAKKPISVFGASSSAL